MIAIRRSAERGHADRGWLRSFHSFSFANYHDPAHMGFGPLRVINEDWFAPGRGFGTHPHDNMEIVTVVLSGTVAHADSTGAGGTLGPGDIQRMSAGRGVRHSEFNGSETHWLHLLQIWIEPNEIDVEPRYGEQHFPEADQHGRWQALVSRDGRDGSLPIHQLAELYSTRLTGQTLEHALEPGRRAYLHVVDGAFEVGGHALATGDAALATGEDRIACTGTGHALLFDLP
ncbi:MAG: pirin family protein [Armatimonadota bacterium]